MYRGVVDDKPAIIFSHLSLGAGKHINVPTTSDTSCWLDPWLLICPVFLLHLVNGLPFDFQQGIWFPQNGPKMTKDSAFLAELHQALAVMEDLIKSCELAMDLAAVTGCPVCYFP